MIKKSIDFTNTHVRRGKILNTQQQALNICTFNNTNLQWDSFTWLSIEVYTCSRGLGPRRLYREIKIQRPTNFSRRFFVAVSFSKFLPCCADKTSLPPSSTDSDISANSWAKIVCKRLDSKVKLLVSFCWLNISRKLIRQKLHLFFVEHNMSWTITGDLLILASKFFLRYLECPR